MSTQYAEKTLKIVLLPQFSTNFQSISKDKQNHESVYSRVRFLNTNLKQICLHQAGHAEELAEVNNKLQTAQEYNRTSQEKQEALENELHSTEDEVNNLTRQLDNLKSELEMKEEQLQKELDEQGW